MKKDFNLILSTACLIYFASLIYISSKQIILNDVLKGIFEFSTIPFILLTVVLLGLSFKAWYSDKWKIETKSFLSVLILSIAVALMIFATVYNV